MENAQTAEISLPSTDIAADIAFFTERLGFQLDTIFPADNPLIATISGHGLRFRLDREATGAPAVLRLTCLDPDALAKGERELIAPNGLRIQIVGSGRPGVAPLTHHEFIVRRMSESQSWVKGRAGMLYRDLIPSRLGGAVIASHIRIPDAGPVPDLVHFHAIGFQLIFCYHGWVRVVYEDQGPAFTLAAGDCVIQPPGIRHRVLEASGNLDVIELSVPAEHLTTMDHSMVLPTAVSRPDREFEGQRFCRSEAAGATWTPWRLPGFEARETGIAAATAGKASVRVARPTGRVPDRFTRHAADILFGFVLSGSLTLRAAEEGDHALSEGDAFVIPPGLRTCIGQASENLQLLEVALPGDFDTLTD